MTLREVVGETANVAEQPMWMPPAAASAICSFVVDRKTGNVTLNIRDGKILGFRIEEIHSIR